MISVHEGYASWYGYIGEKRKVEGKSMRQRGDNDESCRVEEG